MVITLPTDPAERERYFARMEEQYQKMLARARRQIRSKPGSRNQWHQLAAKREKSHPA